MNRLPPTASTSSPAASTMPTAMAQNRKAMSMGSFTAVRNRTMLKAPTMPRESTMLLTTVKISNVVMRDRATSVTPKLGEYITPA